MQTREKILISIGASFAALLAGIVLGSVFVAPGDVFRIISHHVLGTGLPGHITPGQVAIVWSVRLPRVLLAFLTGAALSVSGAVMQSVLRNPLAASYTLGVSSGASFGASLVILVGINLPVLSLMSLPILGFAFGLGTIFLVMAIATKLDAGVDNQTIILTGIVFSLFINAITTMMFAFFRESAQRMIFWQMGSFSMQGWQTVLILIPVTIVGICLVMRYKWELDVLTFGEDQAKTMGVSSKNVKWLLLIFSAALTGSTIAFVGVIGFVDLIAPHIVRRVFGASHRVLIPMSAVVGGAFMVLCDLAARTLAAPVELPVGAVTALIGAPFFAYIYFGKRKGG